MRRQQLLLWSCSIFAYIFSIRCCQYAFRPSILIADLKFSFTCHRNTEVHSARRKGRKWLSVRPINDLREKSSHSQINERCIRYGLETRTNAKDGAAHRFFLSDDFLRNLLSKIPSRRNGSLHILQWKLTILACVACLKSEQERFVANVYSSVDREADDTPCIALGFSIMKTSIKF